MKKILACLAGVLALLGVVALAGVLYFVSIFPWTMTAWEKEGRRLSDAEQALANMCGFCESFGHIVIPLLVLVVIACGGWTVLAGARSGQRAEN